MEWLEEKISAGAFEREFAGGCSEKRWDAGEREDANS
jgi:hypothetical protein